MSGFDIPIQFIGSCFLATFAPQMCARDVYIRVCLYMRVHECILFTYIVYSLFQKFSHFVLALYVIYTRRAAK